MTWLSPSPPGQTGPSDLWAPELGLAQARRHSWHICRPIWGWKVLGWPRAPDPGRAPLVAIMNTTECPPRAHDKQEAGCHADHDTGQRRTRDRRHRPGVHGHDVFL